MNFGIILAFLFFNVVNNGLGFVNGQSPSTMITIAVVCKDVNYNTPSMRKICASGENLQGGQYYRESRVQMACMCLTYMTGMISLSNHDTTIRLLLTFGLSR